ncbi:hypothetical protein K7I13_02945 [Brucepastera parasyntrophica]|uniref:DUF7019 family protein n=1 Tax=Brucepastera parasyntrophica TaxID=2880008 RepID=UPI002108F702|nr:hypothetical protein [Brucepastera parasyntrophica]ULQ60285.1 hypothetical protein K7I13_02945 [Brucepastera parasyntrophica]
MINKNVKDYLYLNKRLIDNIYSQVKQNNRLEYNIGFFLKVFSVSIKKETIQADYHKKIIKIYSYLEKKGCLKEYGCHFDHNDYYCLEKQCFIKVTFEKAKIKTKHNLSELCLYISENRSFSKYGSKSPLVLLPDNINENISWMNGSSGYSIFKVVMENYFECNEEYIKQISKNSKINFAQEPISFFKNIGCTLSDNVVYEIFYKKRNILKDDIHNIVYTFGYPLYIATTT